MLIVRTPDGRLTFLQAIGSRRKADVAAGIPAAFTGPLITDGYTGYQHLLARLAGIQQCAQHVIRRCRAVTKLGPGGLQSWAGDIITILREAHQAVESPRPRQHRPGPAGTPRPPRTLRRGRQHRDHPQPAAGLARAGTTPATRSAAGCATTRSRSSCSPATSTSSWTNNVSERGAKAAKRHQAVSGYWHSLATLARWCRVRSYLDSAAAHGITALDAIRGALAGKPWLPPLPASA